MSNTQEIPCGFTVKAFLARKNIEFSLKRYGIEAMGYMALGIFASLIVGTILDIIGKESNTQWLIDYGKMAMSMMGPSIAVAVAYGLKSPPLVLFSVAAVGQAAVLANGGPAGCFVAAIIAAEFGKLISRETKIDIIVTPAVTLIIGIAVATLVSPPIGTFMNGIGKVIVWATDLQPVIMGAIVAGILGMALTSPLSSVALTTMLGLSGLAAGAATVGCCCQMVGFAVSSYRENRWGGLIAQGIGTSKLQLPNIIRNPRIWLSPSLAGASLGPLATTWGQMSNTAVGAGMGTSGFVGQFGTIASMGASPIVFLKIALLHIILPAAVTLLIAECMRKKGWIKFGDMKLDI